MGFNEWIAVEACTCPPPTGGGGEGMAVIPVIEAIAVTGVNTFAPLTNMPLPNPVTLMVNGRGFFPVGSPPDFTVSGNIIIWLNSIYAVSPSDDVVALYYYSA